MSVTITDNDRGLKRVLMELIRLRGGNVTIGIHQQDDGRDGDGPSNVLIGSVHEFGAPDHKPPIPARPFLRPGVRTAEPAIRRVMEAGLQAVMRSETTGQQVLQAMGEVALRSVLMRINAGIKPGLAPATILNRIRRTKKGRKIVAAGSRTLKRSAGKGATARHGKAVARLAQAMGGNFTPLVDTGALRASITAVVSTGGV